MAKNDDHTHKFVYHVDDQNYEQDSPQTTGAAIKARLPEAKRSYSLYSEGHGQEADKLIDDSETISLDKGNTRRFYTVPPATFGL